MAWFGLGETLGKLLMKDGSGGVCSVYGGQQPLVWPDLVWQKYSAVSSSNGYAEVSGMPKAGYRGRSGRARQ